MAESQQEAEKSEQSENDAAKHNKEALDWLIQAVMEVVEFAKANNLLRWEIIDAEDKLTKAVQAKNSHYCIQKAGLDAEACITCQATRPVDPVFTPGVNAGKHVFKVEQETIQDHGRFMAPTEGQGVLDYIDMPLEQYNSITHMLYTMLADTQTQTSLC